MVVARSHRLRVLAEQLVGDAVPCAQGACLCMVRTQFIERGDERGFATVQARPLDLGDGLVDGDLSCDEVLRELVNQLTGDRVGCLTLCRV